MRKLIAGMKISLDGKTEGADGMADWVEAWSEDFGLTDQIDACLMGGGMYPGYERYWTGLQTHPDEPAWITGAPPTAAELSWADFAAHTPHYVLSRSLRSATWPNTRFLRNLDDVSTLKAAKGKDIYLMGGARIAAALMDAGLVDELRLIVHPIIAGEGPALFAAGMQRRKAELLNAETKPKGLLKLTYALS
ncbi:MAG: dihydrofolate reductase family protein [Phenylobacterium sp.]|uniref:dihydrofolate reductase family protein n=1 Tax=Phenylobacterium sp. TaxID=1871053 RepID=UPI002736D739|nr:dihydrofolate reductase family protein [Phenylobacterium sp.]MDP3749541.1 dihydrofolate reductase family protein [Phenylobacterium sp.]